MFSNRDYYLGFSAFKGIGPMRMQRLLDHFGEVKNVWNGDAADLEKILGKNIAERFLVFRKTLSIKQYMEDLEKKSIQFLTIEDKEYPVLLKTEQKGRANNKTIEQSSNGLLPPFILYYIGDVSLLNYPKTIAVVGTRRITNYGKQVTEILTLDLVNNGFVIVSGLALGVDAVSHKKTMESGGKTIAVLGCGVDCCFPKENKFLYEEIISTGGLIVSQFLPSTKPLKGSFPARNRIIAGLSLGTVVTEGSDDSGALITADYAFKYKRSVFAVPGPITSILSKGPNTLLQKGAVLSASGKDIILELKKCHPALDAGSSFNSKKITGSSIGVHSNVLNKDEKDILNFLKLESLHFNEIARRIGRPTSELGVILSLMEVRGIVKNNGGVYSLFNC